MLANQPAPAQCRHCGDLGIDAPGTACVLCGKRETDARCNRCLDTGAYEARRSAWSYSDTEMVRCARCGVRNERRAAEGGVDEVAM